MDKSENKTNITIPDADKRILDYGYRTDYALMKRYLDIFSSRYDFMTLSYIGDTVLGKSIPMVTLGDKGAEKSVLYVGAHHGMEWITTILLLRFINEYCECYLSGRRLFDINIRYLFAARRIAIIPMLNCDGVDIQQHGIPDDCPLRARLMSMSDGDFSHWQANARGVDLNHNYNAGFAEYKKLEKKAGITGGCATRYSGTQPESEPEVAALCSLLRFDSSVQMIMTFHSQGEEIFYSSGDVVPPKAKSIGRLLERMSGYALRIPEGMAAYGGLTDWYIREMMRPSFTIECGLGTNPLPCEKYFSIYAALRKMLFTAPMLI